MKKKELTVIIPTFNRSNSLILILQSLSHQSIKEYKINVIICDSYSKDGSEKNVKFFSKYQWKIANKKNFILTNYFSRKKIMTFKFKIKKNTIYSILI